MGPTRSQLVLQVSAILLLWGIWPVAARMSTLRLGETQALLWATLASFVGMVIAFLSRRGAGESFSLDAAGIGLALVSGAVSVVGTLIFYRLLARTAAGRVTALAALYPLVTVILSWLLFGEHLNARKLVGIFLAVLAGFLLSMGE